MESTRSNIRGSDYVGVFCTATEKYVIAPSNINSHEFDVISKIMGVEVVKLNISGSDIVGMLTRANSNGIVVSNLILDEELEALKSAIDTNVHKLDSRLNAIGSNILANDKIAIINPEYTEHEEHQISDALGVEAIRMEIGGLKTVGANNILTNKGIVLNNRASDEDQQKIINATRFKPIMSTGNTGAVSVGLAAIANSKGVLAGSNTTGFELSRIIEALEGY